jgi:hypothetical protein
VVAIVSADSPAIISSGAQSISVTIDPPYKTRSAGWTDATPSRRQTLIVVKVHFQNTGTKPYGSNVDEWCWLSVKGNKRAVVKPNSLDDYQGDFGRIDLEPGKGATWKATFLVRKTAEPVSFTYQGPGNRKVTWTF